MRALRPRSASRQSGQALVYGLSLVGVGLGVLFFLFNAGQLALARVGLVNAADAAAYSGAVVDARFLNFQSYVNRALLADTIATAQTVSITSWLGYLDAFKRTVNPDLAGVGKYPGYLPQVRLAGLTNFDRILPQSSKAPLATPMALFDVGTNQSARMLMDDARSATSAMLTTRDQTVRSVAAANAQGDGALTVRILPWSPDPTSFVSSYGGQDRGRFADLSASLANLDSFVRRRVWVMPGRFADCPTALATGRPDFLLRLGGTQLRGFDEWRALDTLSEHIWIPLGPFDPFCLLPMEFPVAFDDAVQQAVYMPPDLAPLHYNGSMLLNPIGTVLAQASTVGNVATGIGDATQMVYPGIPTIEDLSPDQRALADPRLGVAVRLERGVDQIRTSQGSAAIPATANLNAYVAAPSADNALAAEATAEAYFERPPGARSNVYGAARGTPHELPSLFNPFWQARLSTAGATPGAAP